MAECADCRSARLGVRPAVPTVSQLALWLDVSPYWVAPYWNVALCEWKRKIMTGVHRAKEKE